MLGTEAMVGVARDREPDTEIERTFERFFAEEYERLGRALFLLTGDGAEAEDLAQEALVRLLERWDRVGKMDSPTGYLYRTALNLHRSRRRRVRRSRVPRGEDQRAALILVEWLGLSSTEAGAILGIEPVSVRVRIARAKRALRDQAESEES